MSNFAPPNVDANSPFTDLDQFIALPRLSGLALSPDGKRLVVNVATLVPDRTKYTSALWQLDPFGVAAPHRLTRSAEGEREAVFLPSGDLVFTSTRPGAQPADPPASSVWLLPGGGGEARQVGHTPGGLSGLLVATSSSVVCVATSLLPSAQTLAQDAELRDKRSKAKVNAILHSGYPVRHWDHDLGPGVPHRLVADVASLRDQIDIPAVSDAAEPVPSPVEWRPLVGGVPLSEHTADLSADGSFLVTTWQIAGPGPTARTGLVVVDVATGERRTLLDEPNAMAYSPVISPDMTRVAYFRQVLTTAAESPVIQLVLHDLNQPEGRVVGSAWDRWPSSVRWLPDSNRLLVTADDDGAAPIFLVSEGPDPVMERVTGDAAAYTDLVVSPEGSIVYALRSRVDQPPHVVRVDLASFIASGPVGQRTMTSGALVESPVAPVTVPGTLHRVHATAEDGTTVPAWLVLPEGASAQHPAPLLVWVHGGPLSSWNAWSWRWCPWLAAAQGYAVMLPDPALSTGYGREYIQRGWGRWGDAPFTDIMALTDVVTARDEIDADRTALMGGSFGGYMANWVAGHTDRFRAIVSHASLWAMDQFTPTTDHAYYWSRELTAQMVAAWSPHHAVHQITTPMLVIHGDRDYRVPIGESLRLWYELLAHSGLPADDHGQTQHRFLYFPTENHWVLAPQHAKVWYGVVWSFLADHIPGVPQQALPQVLG